MNFGGVPRRKRQDEPLDSSARTMIVIDAGSSRFQFRAGALIWCSRHILIHRAVSDSFWALPGGRVEFHEAGTEALAREIEEEMGCNAAIGPLRFVIENFFELGRRKAHEIGFYYEAELVRPFPFHETDIVHRSRDGNTDLEFRWVLPRNLVSGAIALKPAPLVDLIETSSEGVVHVVHRD